MNPSLPVRSARVGTAAALGTVARHARTMGSSTKSVLLQSVGIALLCGAMVALNQLELAAYVMWGLLGLAAGRLVFQHKPDEAICLLVALTPMINLLRGVILYTAVPILCVMALAYVAWNRPLRARRILEQHPAAASLFGLTVLYYLMTVATTLNLRDNMRIFEMTCVAMMMVFLSARKRLIQAAMVGLFISTLVVGLSAFPHLETMDDQRLGTIMMGDFIIGNPVALGTPLALGVLVLCFDRGRWLGLDSRPMIRLVALLLTVTLLALSASRAGWLVAAAGLVLGALLSRRERIRLIIAVVAVALLALLGRGTPLAEPFEKGLQRTFGEDRDLRKATTGRSDQWLVFLTAFTDSPRSILIGHGPGLDAEVFEEFSRRTLGIESYVGAKVPFHGLAMHLGAELGLAGLIPLVMWLAYVAKKTFGAYLSAHLAVPLLALLGFFLISLTVTGFDTVSGTFLGLALSAEWAQPRSQGRRVETRSMPARNALRSH